MPVSCCLRFETSKGVGLLCTGDVYFHGPAGEGRDPMTSPHPGAPGPALIVEPVISTTVVQP